MTASDPNSEAAGAEIVRTAARDGDIDRYIAALMAPADLRTDLLAIAAFGAVIGHVPSSVNEPMMGEIRLQWWRDALVQGRRYEVIGQPVADAVAATAARRSLDRRLFDTAIDSVSHVFVGDLGGQDTDPVQALAKFEGALFTLTARIYGGASVAGFDPLFEQAGRAYGLARALCRIPLVLRAGWPPLPPNLAAAVEAATAAETSAAASEELAAAFRHAQEDARMALAEIRRHAALLPPAAIAALTPLVMVEPYLQAQSRAESTLLASPVEVMPLKRMWRIWRATRRLRF